MMGADTSAFFEGIEGHKAFLVEVERGVFCQQISQGSGYMGQVLNEPIIETSMTQETPDPLDICRRWQLFDNIDLCPTHFYPSLRHSMFENNSFSNHKVTLFLVKN